MGDSKKLLDKIYKKIKKLNRCNYIGNCDNKLCDECGRCFHEGSFYKIKYYKEIIEKDEKLKKIHDEINEISEFYESIEKMEEELKEKLLNFEENAKNFKIPE